LDDNEFWQEYIDGTEYSILVYRDYFGEAVFPPVWKDKTNIKLDPPWKRLRLCPAPNLSAECDRRLRKLGLNIARAADAEGFIEVEVVETRTGDILVFEINPRVSGTMRICALATALPIFSLHRRPNCRGDLKAIQVAGEVPYSGTPFNCPRDGIFATSRLTAAAPNWTALWKALSRYRSPA
jgi:carbamoylphosphate synthase large subunit